MNKQTALVVASIALSLAGMSSCDGRAADREDQKESLRLQATEFCATVKKPPAVLAEAINGAIQQDPKTWAPVAEWWNRIYERYEKAGCGDA